MYTDKKELETLDPDTYSSLTFFSNFALKPSNTKLLRRMKLGGFTPMLSVLDLGFAVNSRSNSFWRSNLYSRTTFEVIFDGSPGGKAQGQILEWVPRIWVGFPKWRKINFRIDAHVGQQRLLTPKYMRFWSTCPKIELSICFVRKIVGIEI